MEVLSLKTKQKVIGFSKFYRFFGHPEVLNLKPGICEKVNCICKIELFGLQMYVYVTVRIT